MVLWLLATLAHAVPAAVHLPPGESEAEWERAFLHAGVEVQSDAPAHITLLPLDTTWAIEVVSAEHTERRVLVDIPHHPADVETIAQLASSLLASATPSLPLLPLAPPVFPLPAAAPSPTAKPALVPVDIRTTPVPIAMPPQPLAIPATDPTPTAVASILPAAMEPPRADSAPPRPIVAIDTTLPAHVATKPNVPLWARIRTGITVRTLNAPSATAAAFVGVAVRPWIHLGAGLGAMSPAPIPLVGPLRRMWSIDGMLGIWLAAHHVEFGVLLGGSRRTFVDASDPVSVDEIPFGALEAAVPFHLSSRLSVRPVVRIQRDLTDTHLFVDDRYVGALVPTSLHLDLDLEWKAQP